MQADIIVCGLGRTGYKIYTLLRRQGAKVVGISDRPITVQLNENIVIGDLRATSTLIEAGIKEARTLVLASNDDALSPNDYLEDLVAGFEQMYQ
jgi:Trk K+ transport system NAD-binding subunit